MTEDPLQRLEQHGHANVPEVDPGFTNRLESKLRVAHSQLASGQRRRRFALGFPRLGVAIALAIAGIAGAVILTGSDAGVPVSVIDHKAPPQADQPDIDGGQSDGGSIGDSATPTPPPVSEDPEAIAPVASATPESLPTASPTAQATETPVDVSDGDASFAPEPSPTATPEPNSTARSATPSVVTTPTLVPATSAPAPTQTPPPSATPVPASSRTPTVVPATPIPAPTQAPSPSATPVPAATRTPAVVSSTPVPAPTPTPPPSVTPASTATPTTTPTATPTPVPERLTISLSCQSRVVGDTAGVVCSWDAPVVDVDIASYQVWRSRNGGDARVVSNQRSGAATTYVDRDVEPGDELVYLVRARSGRQQLVAASVRETVVIPS